MLFKFLTFIMILSGIISYQTFADETDSLEQLYVDSYAIADISNYDSDGILDTLLAKAGRDQYMIPYKILWGDNTNGTARYITEFHYPEKAVFDFSAAPIDRNNDNNQDLMFFISGYYIDTDKNEINIDRTITIYGHNSLKNISDIDITELEQSASAPFYYTVMEDCSGIGRSNIDYEKNLTQYELETTNIVIPPQYKETLEKELNNTSFSLSPNPASESTTLEIIDKSQHSFEISIVDMKGSILEVFDVENSKINKVDIPLDQFSSGTYNVVIKCNNVRVDVLQLVVIK